MAEYAYKGFKIYYEVTPSKTVQGLYQATGYVMCSVHEQAPTLSQKFQTEYPTKIGVRKEIKKLIETYIDFEWKEFLEMQE